MLRNAANEAGNAGALVLCSGTSRSGGVSTEGLEQSTVPFSLSNDSPGFLSKRTCGVTWYEPSCYGSSDSVWAPPSSGGVRVPLGLEFYLGSLPCWVGQNVFPGSFSYRQMSDKDGWSTSSETSQLVHIPGRVSPPQRSRGRGWPAGGDSAQQRWPGRDQQ